MGYYTMYELSVDKRGDEIDAFTADWTGSAFNNYALEYQGEGSNHWYPYDRVKWYEHDEDMIELSNQFPDVLFTLDGEGESGPDDIWRKWYKGGRCIGSWGLVVNKPEYPEGYTP